jgi:hypothetical protein
MILTIKIKYSPISKWNESAIPTFTGQALSDILVSGKFIQWWSTTLSISTG